MQKHRLLTVIPWVLLLTACSTLSVDYDYDPSRSFTDLKTYAWVPGTPIKTNNPEVDTNTLVQDRIRHDLANWLNTHGYTPGEEDKVDFLVTYLLVVKDKTRIRVINDYYDYPLGWRYGYGGYYGGTSQAYTYEYKEGTLIIDFVDPKTKKLIWRGVGTDEVMASATPQERNRRIREAVDKIMGQFPPPAKK